MGMLLLNGSSEFGVRRELFANGEQGLWLDPSDMTAGKAAWRRNLLTYSEQFDNSVWAKLNATATANATPAPDGTSTAEKIFENSTGNVERVVYPPSPPTVTVATYTFSVYAKASENIWIYVRCDNGTSSGAWFNLQTGAVGTVEAGISAAITNAGNGWYRCSVTKTLSAGTGYGAFQLANADNVKSYVGVVNNGIFVWGAQLELGSTPSEYQPITDFSTEFKAAFPTHTLYQDSNGVTPCTAAGDPVGLILDQSRGGLANLGSEIVTNGGLSDATGWTVSGASPPSITGGQAVWSASTGEIQWASSLTVGKWYKLEFDLVSCTSGNLAFRDGTTNTSIATAGAVAGRKTFLINATSTQIRFISFASATVTIDNISVREVPGNHAYQTTSASRPTLARIPSSGRRNLLTYSEQLDNAAWTKRGTATITANDITAPDGTATAEQLSGLNTSNNDVFNTNYSSVVIAAAGTNYTPSFWVKRISTSGVFFISNPTSAVDGQWNIDLSQLPDAWTRITATTPGVTVVNAFVTSAGGFGGVLLRAVSGGPLSMHVWGFQSELGSTATNYQKVVATTDVTESGVSDLWHLVFDGSDDSLVTNAVDFNTWTQETRRNLLVATEDFSNAFWIKTNLGVSGNTMTPDATLGQHRIYQQATHTSPHVFSVEAKANGYNFISLAYAGGLSGQSIFFDLSNGTISGSLANFTPTITPVGDGWYRCSLAYSVSIASSAINHFVFIRNAASIADYSGDGVSGVLLRYPQLEQGNTLTTYQRVGTDEMTVIAGVRKLSDAAIGIVAEHGNTVDTLLAAPRNVSPDYGADLRHSGVSSTTGIQTYTAPISNVVSVLFDRSAATIGGQVQVRANGTLPAQNNTGTGPIASSNFTSNVLYIGRRNNATLPYNGHLYQLIIRGRTTPTGKLLEAERFVARKTGVTGI